MAPPASQTMTTPAARPAIVVHGGAGLRDAESETTRTAAVDAAAAAGFAVLAAGGSSLDAVVAAVTWLEDDPLFNAGLGAVLTEDGTVELDASLMRGADLSAGAVAAVRAGVEQHHGAGGHDAVARVHRLHVRGVVARRRVRAAHRAALDPHQRHVHVDRVRAGEGEVVGEHPRRTRDQRVEDVQRVEAAARDAGGADLEDVAGNAAAKLDADEAHDAVAGARQRHRREGRGRRAVRQEQRQALAQHNEWNPGALVKQIRKQVSAFAAGAEQSDDITMLAARIG